jgi:V8-like Glu-specific endopeptidase
MHASRWQHKTWLQFRDCHVELTMNAPAPLLAKCLAHRPKLLAALCIFLMQSAWSAQDSDLSLVDQNSALAMKFAAVGKIISGHGSSFSMATGFMVSACHVLTAGHALAKAGEPVRIGSEIRFIPGGASTAARSNVPVNGRVVAASPDFIMQVTPAGFDQKRIPNDWALIELDNAIPNIEPIKLLYPQSTTPPALAYTVVGYPLGQTRPGLFIQEHCRSWSSAHGGSALEGILIADCAVQAGMSGGPILLDIENETVAAGIMVERFTINQKVMTIAVPTSAFAEKINSSMRESDVCAAGSPFVWPRAFNTALDTRANQAKD